MSSFLVLLFLADLFDQPSPRGCDSPDELHGLLEDHRSVVVERSHVVAVLQHALLNVA
jgi:hypothetical protein